MYSMPIVGTNANLYFSSERTEDPMVVGCVRKNGSSCEKLSNVNNRYLSTESGNNLDMLPNAINFSRQGLDVNLNDGSGINLNSSSAMSLSAGYVGLYAGNISISATSKLVAKKSGTAFISLENDFYNDASIVLENGRDRTSNSPFDDDPQNGVAELKAAMQMQADEAALVASNEGSIPLSGEALEARTDIPEFDRNCQYPEGAIVKKQMDDGTYVLGKANSPNNKNISIFEAFDKEAVSQHTSVGDELKSYGYGLLAGAERFSTGCRQFNDWVGEHVLGLGTDEFKARVESDNKRDAEDYNAL